MTKWGLMEAFEKITLYIGNKISNNCLENITGRTSNKISDKKNFGFITSVYIQVPDSNFSGLKEE